MITLSLTGLALSCSSTAVVDDPAHDPSGSDTATGTTDTGETSPTDTATDETTCQAPPAWDHPRSPLRDGTVFGDRPERDPGELTSASWPACVLLILSLPPLG